MGETGTRICQWFAQALAGTASRDCCGRNAGFCAGRSMIDRTFFRFLLVGIGNTILGLGVISGARQFFTDIVANLIGYLVVVPISFSESPGPVLQDRGSRRTAFLRYIPTIAAGYAANYTMLTSCLKFGANPYLAQTLAIGCHVAVTYLLSRVFVFLTPAESQQ